ncbi:hypothetical protein GB931_21485 [Modestobacter sp. I12A-02628]|uniref:Uncharacterized protein n=1 Tax=Goekera deserti TaxID=2497753 RepID=A0A7K3WBI4_9ACTN|nr:hypothetical protein [Goekera deserti]MPR00448.1 hypothetical protein [Goekera deserti]NDI49155.1 hypothetical protein [Goekera deserti]NEL52893.1 hypothetical protein [Goekera deserti]
MQLGGLPVAHDVTAGAWLPAALGAPGTVASLVPAGYPAHARVFHPAARYDGDDDIDVEWAEVAAENGTVDHPLMQWPAITGGWQYIAEDSQPPTWDGAPSDGHLPVQVAEVLAAVLARHTATPEDCFFGRWDGLGHDTAALAGVPRLVLPTYPMVLVRGRVADAVRNLAPEPWEQSAHVWWPADRSWVVATDVDLMSTYVAAGTACVAELLEIEGLEVAPAVPTDALHWESDEVNPAPPRPVRG